MKKILANWPTHREDWVSVFRPLSTEFHLVFLTGLAKESNDRNCVSGFAKTIHWSDFENVQQLLRYVAPDLVLFMSVDTGLSMVLNLEARRAKIKTFILQHGIYTNYKDYRTRERFWKKSKSIQSKEKLKKEIGFSSLRFISDSLNGFSKALLIEIALYSLSAKKKGAYWTAKHLPLKIKRTDYYLCFSPYNATIHKELDRVSEERIIYLGSPELDNYLTEEERVVSDPYFLHIDQALADNSFGEETVSKGEMILFYLKINEFCQKQGAKLYIKLHPESYQSDWLPKDDNIVYLRKTDLLNAYIQHAEGCFGFYSTMIIPAIYWKRTVLFGMFYSGLQETIKGMSAAQILDFWNFEIQDIRFDKRSEGLRKRIADVFFYETDNKSLLRLKQALT